MSAHIPAPRSTGSDPRFSPSYPIRVHAYEGPRWRAAVERAEGLLAEARRRYEGMSAERRAELRRAMAQMEGARDQIADAARRLPGETGELHEEDRHLVDQAFRAMERLASRFGG